MGAPSSMVVGSHTEVVALSDSSTIGLFRLVCDAYVPLFVGGINLKRHLGAQVLE